MARLRGGKKATITLKLGAVVDAFMLALDAGARAHDTIRGYRTRLGQFQEAVGDVPIDGVTADDCRRFLVACRSRGLAAGTVDLHYRGLVRFFRWAEGEAYAVPSPMRRVERPGTPETQPAGFSDDELRRLLAQCNPRTPLGARNRALLLTLYGTGLRVGELVQLRKEDVRGTLHQHLRVMGKGSRERLIALSPAVRQAMANYLLYRGEDDDPHLWLGERGPLSTRGVSQVCAVLGRRAGVANCHPHRFRNTALNSMLEAGMTVMEVAQVAGHKRLEQLRHYTQFAEAKRANDALQQTSFVEKLLAKPKSAKRR